MVGLLILSHIRAISEYCKKLKVKSIPAAKSVMPNYLTFKTLIFLVR